jgi:imidazole glycerol-phosphate synthase subunit HisH
MSIKTVGILNYGLGNLLSITRAFEKIGCSVTHIDNPEQFHKCTHLVLPGVGAYKNGMRKLSEYGFIEPLRQWHDDARPLLGICLGMQMMLSKSEEFGEHEGLGLIEGVVSPIKSLYKEDVSHKIPHIGWTDVLSTKDSEKIGHFYLVHSYACFTDNPEQTSAIYKYECQSVPSIIRSKNTIGVQFHPEKSREDGLGFLAKFII